jgi:hypothetical protein
VGALTPHATVVLRHRIASAFWLVLLSDGMAARFRTRGDAHGHGLWVMSHKIAPSQISLVDSERRKHVLCYIGLVPHEYMQYLMSFIQRKALDKHSTLPSCSCYSITASLHASTGDQDVRCMASVFSHTIVISLGSS